MHSNCENVKVPGEFSDFAATCGVLTVNVQMVVGGCCLTLLTRTLCTAATTSRLAEQHFNWSHFCQTRQAKTHLRNQGVPADTHPHAHTHIHTHMYKQTHACMHTHTHYCHNIPGNLLISQQCWFTPIGSRHSLDQRLNEGR